MQLDIGWATHYRKFMHPKFRRRKSPTPTVWSIFQAVTVLAGFYVSEQYRVPWVEVDVPQALQAQLFPFAEEAPARVKTSNPGPVNYGTINFLELLQQLRPFFWQGAAAIHCVFPEYALLKRLKVLQTMEAAAFFTKWPDACEVKDAGNRAMNEIMLC
ncbi:hypothetical protein EDB86DRAFT_3166362 [Lactarius hatsudake]|nr:hypothetical protein EDB86DRAFT_3166362 [Lactarius hatsudake]